MTPTADKQFSNWWYPSAPIEKSEKILLSKTNDAKELLLRNEILSKLISAPFFDPNVILLIFFSKTIPFNKSQNSLSTGYISNPPFFKPEQIFAFSIAISLRQLNEAKCAVEIFVIIAVSGEASFERGSISPFAFIPISHIT